MKNIPKNERSGPGGFTGEFYPTFRDGLKPLPKLFPKSEEEMILPNTFYGANITLTKLGTAKETNNKMKM